MEVVVEDTAVGVEVEDMEVVVEGTKPSIISRAPAAFELSYLSYFQNF